MICPKWLVQSSAVGAFSAVLIAVPLWMSAEEATSADEPSVESTSVYQIKNSPSAATSPAIQRAKQNTQQAQNEAQKAVEEAGVYRMRYYLIDGYQGPRCPVRLQVYEAHPETSEALNRARTIVEWSAQQAAE